MPGNLKAIAIEQEMGKRSHNDATIARREAPMDLKLKGKRARS